MKQCPIYMYEILRSMPSFEGLGETLECVDVVRKLEFIGGRIHQRFSSDRVLKIFRNYGADSADTISGASAGV